MVCVCVWVCWSWCSVFRNCYSPSLSSPRSTIFSAVLFARFRFGLLLFRSFVLRLLLLLLFGVRNILFIRMNFVCRVYFSLFLLLLLVLLLWLDFNYFGIYQKIFYCFFPFCYGDLSLQRELQARASIKTQLQIENPGRIGNVEYIYSKIAVDLFFRCLSILVLIGGSQ